MEAVLAGLIAQYGPMVLAAIGSVVSGWLMKEGRKVVLEKTNSTLLSAAVGRLGEAIEGQVWAQEHNRVKLPMQLTNSQANGLKTIATGRAVNLLSDKDKAVIKKNYSDVYVLADGILEKTVGRHTSGGLKVTQPVNPGSIPGLKAYAE